MFTGLVAGQGEVVSLSRSGSEVRISIRALLPFVDPQAGESIAVNGTCLTVETWSGNTVFSAYISAESAAATNLGNLRPGQRVNLERALSSGERFGGHMVSGHVDCTARVSLREKVGESTRFRLEFDSFYSKHVIPKGSITLDGVSLTVNSCGSGFLEVNIIPETLAVTTIGQWKTGYEVNMETDLIGKYVTQTVELYLGREQAGAEAGNSDNIGIGSGLTLDFLRQQGF